MAITLSVSSIPAANLLANGSQSVTVGPVNVVISQPVLEVIPVTFSGASTITTASPAGSTVCLIVGPSGTGTTPTLSLGAGAPAMVVYGLVSLVQFANPAVSNNVALTSSGAIAGAVYLCFY